ncbi:baseplate J/gp47 family protein [Aphanizomenon sp. PH219]|nr:baseplate J/gp47 family protein [Aphanizomenon sp. 202]MDK2457725.1 baseplate J/gp47 family protein [Aphanizomenon sp. PH219]
MFLPPPKIDQRTYEDIVQETQELTEDYTDNKWRCLDKSDSGLALIRIFSRMATIVSDRLNRSPDRNLLAFLNLIGTQQAPPQPARVPLTFTLAGGSPVDAIVPAHTQVSAPAPEGETEEVIFETEQDLVVSGTQLQAMFVAEDRDYYSDRNHWIDPTIANQNPAFSAFKGDLPTEHYLYIYSEEIFSIPKLETITITIDTNSPTQFGELLDIWSYWEKTAWKPLTHIHTQANTTQFMITVTQLPKLMPFVQFNGQKAPCLRVSLKSQQRNQLAEAARNNLPEVTQIEISTSINQTHTPELCLFNNTPLDLSKDFYPFGTTPGRNDTFSIPLDNKLIKPGVAIEISPKLNHQPSYTDDINIIWEIGNGQNWQIIETSTAADKFRWSNDSSPIKFIEPTEPITSTTFQFPQSLINENLVDDHRENSYWLRARINNGIYGIRGREKKYVVYNDVTLVSRGISSGQTAIFVDSVDELEINDTIRIQSLADPTRQEEVRIINKIASEKKLILENNIRNQYEASSRILCKFIMVDKIPDTCDPPVVQSLTLTYKFLLRKPASYYAYNDFIYCEGSSLGFVRLTQAVKAGERILHLDDVSQLRLGELIKFDDNNPEKRQIELIDRDRHLVIFTTALNHDHRRAVRVIRCFHPLTPAINRNSALYLGFNQPFPNRPNTLYLQVEPPLPSEVAPNANRGEGDLNLQRIAWEYASPNGWQPLVVQDETQAFAEKGLIRFIGLTDFIPSSHFGKELYWLRARKKPSSIPFALLCLFKWALGFRRLHLFGLIRYLGWQISYSVDFSVDPRLRSVRTNTTWASQTITLENEILGSSNNEPQQVFSASQVPILWGQQLEVQEGKMPADEERQVIELQSGSEAISTITDETGQLVAVWVRWQEVPDFYSSQTKDRHYVIDRQTGKIQFGDGKAGMIPPRGRNNIRLTRYHTGGGIRGNQPAYKIAELKTTIPYIDSVINWEAATGGNEQESLERLKERSPQRLRHRDRAVTAQDFEDLTYQASIDVARVKVITPEMMVPNFNPLLEELWIEPEGNSSLAKITEVRSQSPKIEGNPIQVFTHEIRAGRVRVIIVPHSLERQPTPNLALLNRVHTYLQARFVPTMKLQVTGPNWQEIRIITEIVPVSLENADAVRVEVQRSLHNFLHPLTGGNQGVGWSFGRKPHLSDLYALLEAVPGVKYVRYLDIQPTDCQMDIRTLIYSGQHRVTLKLPGETD